MHQTPRRLARLGEQIGRYSGPIARRHEKRVHSKAHRRLAKLLLEDAPPRSRYCGWND